jgi:hypothetical protein
MSNPPRTSGDYELFLYTLTDQSSERQRLDEHLKNAAEMARSFSEVFGLAAYISGSYTPCLPHRRIKSASRKDDFKSQLAGLRSTCQRFMCNLAVTRA